MNADDKDGLIALTKQGMQPPQWIHWLLLSLIALLGWGIWWVLSEELHIRDVEKNWEQVPCELLYLAPQATDKDKHGTSYALDIRYRYAYRGRVYVGERYCIGEQEMNHDGISKRFEGIAHAKAHRCYVNPQNPGESVYEPTGAGRLMQGLLIIFSLVELFFIACWVDVLRRRLRMRHDASGQQGAERETDEEAEAELEKSQRRTKPFVSLLFLAISLGGFYLLFHVGHTAYETIKAESSWVRVPCRIEHMEWDRAGHRSGGHRLDIAYRYTYGGKDYRGTRFDFWNSLVLFGLGRERMERLARTPAPTCYVNPQRPEESVCDPSLSWWQLVLQGGMGLGLGLYMGKNCLKLFRRG